MEPGQPLQLVVSLRQWEGCLYRLCGNGNGYSPEVAKQAVATLMRDCAVMIQSDFCPVGSFGTSASAMTALQGLQKYMKYDQSARCIQRYYYPFDEWKQMMKAELDAGRPVLYSGGNNEGGHAFVLDGYDSGNYFRVNWGWGGVYDGYFLLSALDPMGQGAGGAGGSYNQYQAAVVGLKKDEGGEPVESFRFCYSQDDDGTVYNGLTSSATEFKTNVPFTVNIGFLCNIGSVPFGEGLAWLVWTRRGN